MKNIRSFIFIIIFFAVSLIPFIGMFFKAGSVSSENRTLQRAPSIIDEGGLNKEYFSQMNDYFSDNFAYRVEMVHLNEMLYTKILNHSTNEKVIYGKEGWLYFHETINDFIGKTNLSDNQIDCLVTTLELQREYLKSRGIEYIFTVAPNKNTIYPEFMPDRFVKTKEASVLDRLAAALSKSDVVYTDLKTAIMDEKDKGKYLYYKTDSHWNDFGARVAYNALMSDIQSFFPDFNYDDLYSVSAMKNTAPGDLEKMLFPLNSVSGDDITTLKLAKSYTEKRPFRSVEDANIITTSDVNNYRIMMFRDSFGNSIIPLISNNFGYANYSREFPVSYKNLMEHKPDVVVHEIVQRNVPKLIERAPVMPAIKRKMDLPYGSEADGQLFIEKSGNFIHIFGYLEYDFNKSYKCYATDTNGNIYEAFPILELEKIGDKLPQNNYVKGFSLYLNEEDFVSNIFVVTIQFGEKIISHSFN